MSGQVFWPYPPPDDSVILVRAVGTDFVERVQRSLQAGGFDYFMSGARKDDVTFYVRGPHREQAEKFVRSRMN